MPKPIEDLVMAIRLIEHRAEDFGVRKEDYGGRIFPPGHLAAEWGRLTMALPDTGLMVGPLLGYPSISTDLFFDAAVKPDGRTRG